MLDDKSTLRGRAECRPSVGEKSLMIRVMAWLESIGLSVTVDSSANGFLEGIRIDKGKLFVRAIDDNLVGSLLHEAGHIAVVPSAFRDLLLDDAEGGEFRKATASYLEANFVGGENEDPICRALLQCGECEAIAWSYAAALAAGVPSMEPFKEGFEGHGQNIHDMIQMNGHFGINGLCAAGMCDYPHRGDHIFPNLRRWVQI